MSYVVLPCTGLDKAEGSVSREVALQLGEAADIEIVCPVSLNRTPARYKAVLAEKKVIVIDGCATQCAGKLLSAAGVTPIRKIVVSQVVKDMGLALAPELRLGPEAMDLAQMIAGRIVSAKEAEDGGETAPGGQESPAEFQPASDYTFVVHDKYEFRIPLSGYLFNSNDVWVQVVGNRARVGISDYMQQRLTDITYVDPPQPGASVEQFGELGTVESTKATFEVVSPVSGTVVGINQALVDEPEKINDEPYSAWIVEIELTDWEEDRGLLIDGPAYAAEIERKAAED